MLNDFYKNKKILITGGSGSIGSKIVEQLTQYDVDVIKVLDNNETALFDLGNDLKSSKIELLVGDIRDTQRLNDVIQDVDIIFHVAAYKHVPLCENNPLEAIKTNIIGTQNIIDIANSYSVEKVILVSTDKAVNPINVMGTTKSLAERLIISANKNVANSTKFSCVRFGNVLNSRGSVIPLFKKQIKNGGPLTITDKRMTRFIMDMNDSIKLVLDVGVLSEGGEIFILKMPSFNIVDLAEVMIEYYAPKSSYGKEEIGIKFVGKRMGEKLHEELMTCDEMYRAVDNGDLYIIRDEINKNHPKFNYNSNECQKLSKDEIFGLLSKID